MIRRLKKRLILMTGLSLFSLLALIVMGMNLINYHSITREADDLLTLLTQKKGPFSSAPHPKENVSDQANRFPPHFSAETPYESRYFSVSFPSDDVENANINLTHIKEIDRETALEYAKKVEKKGKDKGFLGNYRYFFSSSDDSCQITFLNCRKQLNAYRRFLISSCAISLIGYLAVMLVVCLLARRIIQPIAESYEKQKRFITDAGHEIKTPLTIIRANADLLEMDLGEDNESLLDIRRQAMRLSELTEQLVYLAKMEETESSLSKISLSLSQVVEETSAPFIMLCESQGKTLLCQIDPNLSVVGNEIALGQLVSILLDNAVKYSPTGSTIHLSLSHDRNAALLSVQNESLASYDKEQLSRIFDRFYRPDHSRNSETGGHGIGLSIALAIVSSHGGKISASIEEKKLFTVTALIPLN